MARADETIADTYWQAPEVERLALSERDSLMVIDLLIRPPAPTARLIRAAKAYRTLD